MRHFLQRAKLIQKENTKKKVSGKGFNQSQCEACEKLIFEIFYPDGNVAGVAHAGCGSGRLPDYPVSGVSP